jgi:predicted site-specific integrase-resolvase
MRAKDVIKLLNVSHITLYIYLSKGYIYASKLPNGYYNFDEESIFKFINNDNRINVIYSRVSTYKQKKDLYTQTQYIINYCNKHNIQINKIYSEISSGIEFDNRNEFINLFNDVIKYKIKYIIISDKDRLTRLSFKTINFLFEKFGTKIIVISNKNDNNEMFNELLSLMHILSTTMYSNRRKTRK